MRPMAATARLPSSWSPSRMYSLSSSTICCALAADAMSVRMSTLSTFTADVSLYLRVACRSRSKHRTRDTHDTHGTTHVPTKEMFVVGREVLRRDGGKEPRVVKAGPGLFGAGARQDRDQRTHQPTIDLLPNGQTL